MVVVVLGANGQLGQCIRKVSEDAKSNMQFYFFNSKQVNIAEQKELDSIFSQTKPDFCINAAAYTAVDLAEIEKEKADLINHLAVKHVAEACLKYDAILIHVSTDFVFDGEKTTPYLESDLANPQGVYGSTKREGELEIERSMVKYFIIRTSWLYSDFGHNFKKTMLRLANEKKSLSVVNDQIGSPTNTLDLANTILAVLKSNSSKYGIYHFSNEGSTSWYGFARKIFELENISVDIKGIITEEYPTLAKRPKYSVLDCSKIKKEFNITISDWETALSRK